MYILQVPLDALAFEASDDVIDGGGRYVQPGSFTLSVGNLTAQARLEGDPLKPADWVRIRSGTLAAAPIGPDMY